MRECKKYYRATQTTDDNMVHAHCMLNNKSANTGSELVILNGFPLQQ